MSRPMATTTGVHLTKILEGQTQIGGKCGKNSNIWGCVPGLPSKVCAYGLFDMSVDCQLQVNHLLKLLLL